MCQYPGNLEPRTKKETLEIELGFGDGYQQIKTKKEMQKGGMLTEKDRLDQHHPWVKFVNILINRLVDHLAADSQVYEDEGEVISNRFSAVDKKITIPQKPLKYCFLFYSALALLSIYPKNIDKFHASYNRYTLCPNITVCYMQK